MTLFNVSTVSSCIILTLTQQALVYFSITNNVLFICIIFPNHWYSFISVKMLRKIFINWSVNRCCQLQFIEVWCLGIKQNICWIKYCSKIWTVIRLRVLVIPEILCLLWHIFISDNNFVACPSSFTLTSLHKRKFSERSLRNSFWKLL